jgi:hypothetical protein
MPHEAPAIRVGDIDTRSALLGTDFAPVISKTDDRSFVSLARKTKATSTLDRPKPEFSDQSRNQDGSVSYNQPYSKVAEVASKMGGSATYSVHPNQQGQTKPDARTLTQRLPPNGR